MNRSSDLAVKQTGNLLRHAILMLTALAVSLPTSGVLAQDKAATALYTEAAGLQNNDEFELALELWDQFATKFPEHSRIVKARHYQGVCCLQLKKIEAASEAFEFVVGKLDKEKDFPQAEDAMLNLGWCRFTLAQQNDGNANLFGKAAESFRLQLKKFPDGKLADQGWYFLGESLYLGGNAGDAVDAYRKVVDGFEESDLRSNAMYALGVALQETDQNQDARKVLETFIDEFKDSDLVYEVRLRVAETILQEAIAARDNSKNDEAKKQFDAAADKFSELSAIADFDQADHAMFQQAFCLINQQKYEDAANTYAQLAEKFGDSQYAREAKLSAGKFYFKAEKVDQARKWLSQASSDKSESKAATEATHWLARLMIKKGEFEQAARVAEKQIPDATGPFQIDLSMDLADALYEQDGKQEQALDLYRKIAEENADSDLAPLATYNAAYAALELKKYDDAMKLANQFEQRFKDDDLANDVRYVRAESLLMTDKPDQAEVIYGDLIKLGDHPDVQSWKVRHAMSGFLQEKYEETSQRLGGEVDKLQGPVKAEAEYLIGASNFFQKKYKPATEWLERRLKSDSSSKQNDEILLLLAQSYFQTDKQNPAVLDKALAQLKRLKSEFPDSPSMNQANYYHGQIAAAKEDFAEAIKQYQTVVDAEQSELTPYAMFGKAWSLQKSKQWKKSVEEFSLFLDKYKDHPLAADAMRGRGTARRMSGDHERALHDLEDSMKIAGDSTEGSSIDAQYEMGLAQVGLKKYAEAINTFQKVVDDESSGELTDDALYQLAWSYKYSGDVEESAKQFGELWKRFAESPFAAESAFHVGEFDYGRDKPEQAVGSYQFARDKSNDGVDNQDLNEKARFKLGWSLYKQDKYDEASRVFEQQVKKHPEGGLVTDAMFMIAESLFQEGNYGEALKNFDRVLPRVKDSEKTAKSIKLLTRLHGAKCGNETKKYKDTLKFLEPGTVEELFGDSDYLADAWLEVGLGLKGKNEREKAIEAFENAAIESLGPTGAHARCMIGEVQFALQKHDDAIKSYKRVMYGYGGDKADDETKKWQALSGYEAGRCATVLIGKEQDKQKKNKLIEQANSLFGYVVDKHSDHDLAAESRKEIQKLATMK